jgi:3-oxoacyl-[acyl-carrier protein] reductase
MFDLIGKNAIVTGASRGIGKAIAQTLAKAGANVALIATGIDSVEKLANEISSEFGVKANGYALNVADYEQTQVVFNQILTDFGSVEILVNNAGITRDGLLMRMKEDDWNQVIDVNLKSVFNTVKALSRSMLRQKYGRIINMSSINGIVAQPGQANYAASKAGVIGITKSLAKEFASKSITVNCIAPGFICTDMTDALSEAQKEEIKKQIPLQSLGSVEDIANGVLFLASSEARYITGQVLSIDGGMNA